MLRQPQRQGDAALLALGSVRARRQAIEADRHVVAVRAHGCRAAPQIVAPSLRQRFSERVMAPLGRVGQTQIRGRTRELVVGGPRRRRQRRAQGLAPARNDLAGGRELGVPHIEGRHGLGVGTVTGLLQEIVALPQDPLEIKPRRSVLAVGDGQHAVEQLAAHRRRARCDRQVCGAEHHGADDLGKIAQ